MDGEIYEVYGSEEKRIKIISELIAKGVKFPDPPQGIYIAENVKIGKGTTIHPNVHISAYTVIGENCIIWSFNTIIGSKIGNFTTVASFCKIEESVIRNEVKIGSHCSISNSEIGRRSEVRPHVLLFEKTVLEESRVLSPKS